jgi:signal transduction histidine kinase
LLANVRAQVLLGSVYVRDALLDPDPVARDTYRAQFERTWRSAEGAVNQYVPVVDSTAERDGLANLRHDLDQFHTTMVDVLSGDGGQSATDVRLLLARLVVPKREIVLRVSDEVQTLNRRAYVARQAGMATVYGTSQRRTWDILGVALLLTLGIAVWSTRYASRLEHRILQHAIEDARTTTELQRLSSQLIQAQEIERRNLARELHDEVGQVLTAIKVELTLAQHAIQAGDDAVEPIERVRRITEGALHSVRDLSHILHPAMLDDFGLPAAADWYLRGLSRRCGIGVELLQEGMNERLAADIELAAYRIIQEALTNVAKHAQATSCRVYLEPLPNTLLVTIEDNGVGFAPASQRRADDCGLGLVSIRERVAQLKGIFRLDSTPGKGTRLTVELPARPRLSTAEDLAGSHESAILTAPGPTHG